MNTKIRKRKCEDGVKREFVRRKVTLAEVWNAIVKEYKNGSKKYADMLLEDNPQLVSFYEGYNAALTASLHILRHFRDGDVVELPLTPPAYIELETADAEINEYVSKKLKEIEEKEKKESGDS